jgi:hypothetical protein
MRLSNKRIKALQVLLKEQTGYDYSDEEAHRAGLAIMRFVLAKEKRAAQTHKAKTNFRNKDKKDARV